MSNKHNEWMYNDVKTHISTFFHFYCQISNYSPTDQNVILLFECLSEAKLNMSVALTKLPYRDMKVNSHGIKADKEFFYNVSENPKLQNKHSSLD